MVIKVRAKSQLTLPNNTVKSLNIAEGDEFEVFEKKDGSILLVPVVTYPKSYIKKLEAEVKETEKLIKAGKQPVYKTVNDMVKALEVNS